MRFKYKVYKVSESINRCDR